MNKPIQDYINKFNISAIVTAQNLNFKTQNWFQFNTPPITQLTQIFNAFHDLVSLSPQDRISVEEGVDQLYDTFIDPAIKIWAPKILSPIISPLANQLFKNIIIPAILNYLFDQQDPKIKEI